MPSPANKVIAEIAEQCQRLNAYLNQSPDPAQGFLSRRDIAAGQQVPVFKWLAGLHTFNEAEVSLIRFEAKQILEPLIACLTTFIEKNHNVKNIDDVVPATANQLYEIASLAQFAVQEKVAKSSNKKSALLPLLDEIQNTIKQTTHKPESLSKGLQNPAAELHKKAEVFLQHESKTHGGAPGYHPA